MHLKEQQWTTVISGHLYVVAYLTVMEVGTGICLVMGIRGLVGTGFFTTPGVVDVAGEVPTDAAFTIGLEAGAPGRTSAPGLLLMVDPEGT